MFYVEQWFSNFVAVDPYVLPMSFDWEIRFGRFLAWAPQPPQQETNFNLWPVGNCRHQNHINKGSVTCNMNMWDYSWGHTSQLKRYSTWKC